MFPELVFALCMCVCMCKRVCVHVCVRTHVHRCYKSKPTGHGSTLPLTKLHSHNAEKLSIKLVVLRNKDSKVLLD